MKKIIVSIIILVMLLTPFITTETTIGQKRVRSTEQVINPVEKLGNVPLDANFMSDIRIMLTDIIDNDVYWRGKEYGSPGEILAANNLKNIWDDQIALNHDYIDEAILDPVSCEEIPWLDDYIGTENKDDFKLILYGINDDEYVIEYPECTPAHTSEVITHEFLNAEVHLVPDEWYDLIDQLLIEMGEMEDIVEFPLPVGYETGDIDTPITEGDDSLDFENSEDTKMDSLEEPYGPLGNPIGSVENIYLIENKKLPEHTGFFSGFVDLLLLPFSAFPLDDNPTADAFILADVNEDSHLYSHSETNIPGIITNGSIGEIIKTNIIENGEGTVSAYFKVKTFAYEDVESYNVVGTINGEVDDIVIIGSHYDSVWGPCAADDAGSNSAVWGIAKYYADNNIVPHYTLKFVAWAGEEFVCRGSKSYINRFKDQEDWRYVITLGALGYKNHSDVPKIDTELNVWKIFSPGYKPEGFDNLINSIDYSVISGGYGGIKVNGDKPLDAYQVFRTDGGFFATHTDGIITIDKGTPDIATHWHHRDGENHTKGNTLDIIDEVDIFASASVVLTLVEHVDENGVDSVTQPSEPLQPLGSISRS